MPLLKVIKEIENISWYKHCCARFKYFIESFLCVYFKINGLSATVDEFNPHPIIWARVEYEHITMPPVLENKPKGTPY